MEDSNMLGNVRVKQFIEQNRANFDPNVRIDEYRIGINYYIQASDEEKIKLKAEKPQLFFIEKDDIKVNRISNNQQRYGKSVIFEDKVFKTGNYTTPARVYSPASATNNVRLPGVIYFTGSGFVHSTPEWQKRNCKTLVKRTGSIVINPQEFVAPEKKFPEGLNQCYELAEWIIQHSEEIGIDKTKINLCGFSSGGNFAAVIARKLRDAGFTILSQSLVSPWLDLTCSSDSYKQFSNGYLLDEEVCWWLRDKYVKDESDVLNPDASPLLYSGKLTGLAPTMIIVGENEPFVDECRKYAVRLAEEDVPVKYQQIQDQIHEFAGCYRWKITTKNFDDPMERIARFICKQIASLNVPESARL